MEPLPSHLTILPYLTLSGLENMEKDLLMLKSTQKDGKARFRFYDWLVPTLSIGKHQPEPMAPHYPWVRRFTGGRGVLHENDLTYAISLSDQGLEGLKIAELYQFLVTPIKLALEDIYLINKEKNENFDFAPHFPIQGNLRTSTKPCFQAPSLNELVFRGKKVLGAAMIKKSKVLFQHGTLLWNPTQSIQKEFHEEGSLGLIQINPLISKERVMETIIKKMGELFSWGIVFSDEFPL